MSWFLCYWIKPNTHCRLRRDETVELSRVGVGGVYMNSQLTHDDCRRIRWCERSRRPWPSLQLKTSMQEQHKSIFLKFGYFDINIVRKLDMGSKNYTCVLVLCIRCWMFHLEQHKITNAVIACKRASIHSSGNVKKTVMSTCAVFDNYTFDVFIIANHKSNPAQGYKCCFWQMRLDHRHTAPVNLCSIDRYISDHSRLNPLVKYRTFLVSLYINFKAI